MYGQLFFGHTGGQDFWHFTNFLYNTPEKNSLCPEKNSLRLKGNEEARRETIYY
jgi:hypothetical protein